MQCDVDSGHFLKLVLLIQPLKNQQTQEIYNRRVYNVQSQVHYTNALKKQNMTEHFIIDADMRKSVMLLFMMCLVCHGIEIFPNHQ